MFELFGGEVVTVVLGILLGVSELLTLTTKVESNGVFQLVVGLLKKAAGK